MENVTDRMIAEMMGVEPDRDCNYQKNLKHCTHDLNDAQGVVEYALHQPYNCEFVSYIMQQADTDEVAAFITKFMFNMRVDGNIAFPAGFVRAALLATPQQICNAAYTAWKEMNNG